ncbi:MAG TPA: cell envelope integrity protein TolA [Paraburkholderia sp.]
MNRPKSAYPLQPPRERGTWRAFALAALMHVLLGFFLYHGIQWQNSTPAGAEAEIWTEVPDLSTPRPAPPPPAPVAPAPPVNNDEADIALQEKKRQQQQAARDAQLAEQQRQQQLQAQQEADAKRQQQLAADQAAMAAALKQKQQQQQQADRLKQQQLAQQQKQEAQKAQDDAQAEAQKKADAQKTAKAKAQQAQQAQAQADAQKKLDQERRARLAQMQGMVGGEGSTGNGLAKSGTGSGAGGTATSPGYAEKVQRRVRPNIVWAGDTQGLETVVAVRCSPTGTLLSATVTRGSGNAQWDDAALRAVQRSDPMPQDTNGKTPASFTITLRPAG